MMETRRTNPARASEGGMTLLELMVAVTVVALSVLGVMVVIERARITNRIARGHVIAAEGVQARFEQIEAFARLNFDDVEAQFNGTTADGFGALWTFQRTGVQYPPKYFEVPGLEPRQVGGVAVPQGEIIIADTAGRISEFPDENLYGDWNNDGIADGADLNGNGTTTDRPAYDFVLNSDGDTTDANVNGDPDLSLLRVVIRVRWREAGQLKEISFAQMLSRRQ